MKRTFVIGGMIFLIGGLVLEPSITPVKAETSLEVKQLVNNTTKTSAVGKQPQVELLNAGTGTKQKLRFQPKVNFKQTATMSLNMDIAMSIAGQTSPAYKQPTTVMTLQTTVTKIDPNGDIHYDFSYSNIDFVGNTNLPPQLLNTMRSQLKKIAGTRGSAIVDNRGYTKQVKLVLPTDLDPNIKQTMQQMTESLEQISAPVPQEAVGIGSQWRVTSALNVSGMNLKQTAIYQLVNLKNGVATLNISVKQLASPSQKLTTSGLPPGMTLTLKSYNGAGQGQSTMALDRLMPIRSNITFNNNVEMIQKSQGSAEQIAINQKISMGMTIESK